MSRRDDDDFRPKVGPPRAKGRGEIARLGKRGARPLRFTTRVLKAAVKSGGSGRTGLRKRASRPGAQSGRGQVASRLAQQNLGPRTRRVIIKTRLVVMAGASPTSTQDYLRYIQRDGASRDGEAGRLYSADLDTVDRETFQNRIQHDRHQFRFIVSPEDEQEIGDLRSYTRDLMAQMERDLGTKLEWVAVNHWDTDDPHTHILLRGKDEYGADLVIAREYIAHGMRARAREVATEWLGPRTEVEIRASLAREVTQERWTSLDETIQHDAFRDGGENPTERSPMQRTSAREQPPVDVDRITNPDQLVTLYRGENEQNASNGEWWTTNRDKAAKYGHVQALTLPARDIAMHSVRGHGGPDERVFPGRRPPELAATATVTPARAAGPASDFLGEFQGPIDLRRETQGKRLDFHKSLQVGRLQHLEKMGLAQELQPGVWSVRRDFETTLRTMGERGDIIRAMQRTFSRERRDFALFDPSRSPTLVGRVVSKGLVDELQDRSYLILDGTDGRAHHVTLPARLKLDDFRIGAVIEINGERKPRQTDRNIVNVARDGLYRASDHLAAARQRERDPDGFVQTHVRRLEALRRAHIVERLDEGLWRVPADLPARGQVYDARRDSQGGMELRAHLPLAQQRRAIGATWLDRQLLARSDTLAPTGFGVEVRQALADREAFLIEHGFAQSQGQRVVLIRNLLVTLQSRELETAAKEIEAQTGLAFRAAQDGEQVSGIYRRSIQLISGRFAMLDDGLGFTLVPWRPIIEKRLDQSLTAVVRGQSVSWELGRQRGLSV